MGLEVTSIFMGVIGYAVPIAHCHICLGLLDAQSRYRLIDVLEFFSLELFIQEVL